MHTIDSRLSRVVPPLLLCLAVLGCGRVGFDPRNLVDDSGEQGGGGRGSGGDASAVDDGGLSDDAMTVDPCMVDADSDGEPDCSDACPDDPGKTAPGMCGCGVPDADADDDGLLDCVDTCGGNDDSRYVPDDTCGVGYCLSSNTPSSCDDGVEVACKPGTPLFSRDATCDGVDDDCDGDTDDDYMTVSGCGLGYCGTTATPSTCSDGVETRCVTGSPLASDDTTSDGIDDDCDGAVDEDAIVCTSETRVFASGTHTIALPAACSSMRVQLWGGGGGSSGSDNGTVGFGGSGGYVERTITTGEVYTLHIGAGGRGCGSGGANAGDAAYNGGAGGRGDTLISRPGDPGGDGVVAGGGPGGKDSGGSDGGDGHYGGGGGGAGSSAPWPPYPTTGGGGGAASVLLDGNTLVMVAGGGGGGGSPSGGNIPPYSGSDGGEGCSGAGADSRDGGGAGGGGLCSGGTATQGAAGVPANAGELPGNQAMGARGGTCRTGGDGYAIVSFMD